ncbi:MAG: Glycosyl transferase family protein [Microgenomates group bacterium GW2011_GWA2_40_6]|nr:MAG: Glycosyl transferase family protein [Microgenomates group bacterium GW2011_GWA2_40_6]
MKKYHYLLLFLSLSIGLLLRLYHLSAPVADWHSYRQVDTASVTKNFSNFGVNLLIPTYHNLSPDQSGLDNPQGLRMVEFPLYNLMSWFTIKLTGLSVDTASRLTSIVLSLFSSLFIFIFVYSLTSKFAPAFLAMLSFLLLPFNIYYSRTILPENAAVFFMTLSLVLFRFHPILSSIFLSLSALCKPFTLLLTLPIYIFLFFRFKKTRNINRLLKIIVFSLISLVPLFLWRHWIQAFPEGIPASAWLLNFSDKRIFPEWYRGYHIDFLNQILILRPYWWRWLILERISLLILGAFGLIPVTLGLFYQKFNINVINFLGFIGITLPKKFLSLCLMLIISAFSLFFSAEKILPYYQINRPEIVSAGKKVDELTPKNSIIIAPYLGDTALLYQTNRPGFPIEIYDIAKTKKLFPNRPLYLVSVNFDSYTNQLIKLYPTLYRGDQFIILDLQND